MDTSRRFVPALNRSGSRRVGFIRGVLITLAAASFATMTEVPMAHAENAPTPPRFYFVRLLGTRPGWPEQMTPREQQVMSEHFTYLKDLTAKKKVLLAGPCLGEPVFGMIILRVDSEEEARALLAGEPSVRAGVHTYELSPMTVSLLAHYVPPARYAEKATGRVLHKEVVVDAPRAAVYEAWTTSQGLGSFFSPYSAIDLGVGGKFEILFGMEAPPGERGSEDCRVLSYLPGEMLSFEWNAPPTFGAMRQKHTHVVVRFEDAEPGKTRVRFDQLGWGEGEEWDAVHAYFDRAWDFVLGNLVKRFAEGPIRWSGE